MTPNAIAKLCDLVTPKHAAKLLGFTTQSLYYTLRKKKLKPVDELRMKEALRTIEELIADIRAS